MNPEANGHAARRLRTRRAILDSASRLFEKNGYGPTTVAMIAASAGVSQRSFYVHFRTKEDLLFAHVQEFAALAYRVAETSTSTDPVDRVHEALRSLIDASCEDRDLMRQAHLRAALGTQGKVPQSLAVQLMTLAKELTLRISASTETPVRLVAPMVGAALGAVEASGLIIDTTGISLDAHRQNMLNALGAALHGFRSNNDSATHPS